MILLELGGIVVRADAAGMELQQNYRVIGGQALRRGLDGSAEKQVQWRKLATSISGAGNLPAGLDGLDFTQAMTLKCVTPRAIASASNVIALPANRRTDAGHVPIGFALFASEWVPTPVSMGGNNATLMAVAGALAYKVLYWPQLTVFAEITADGDMHEASYRWQIECEEV